MAGKTDYKNQWQKDNKQRINLVVDKGMKEIIKEHADQFDGGSVNGFINRAIKETMKADQTGRG